MWLSWLLLLFKTPFPVLSAFSKGLGSRCRPCKPPVPWDALCGSSHTAGAAGMKARSRVIPAGSVLPWFPTRRAFPHAALGREGTLQGRACDLLHGGVTGPTTGSSQPRCPLGGPQAVPEPAGCTAGLMSKHSVFLAAPETGFTSRANSPT